jgi:23S rRNA (guanosine2251-2'-O)-methyltransferase
MIKIRNKNAILELIQANISFEKIEITSKLDRDSLTDKIVSMAKNKNIPVDTIPLGKMAKRRGGQSREVIVGRLEYPKNNSLDEVLDDLYKKDQTPFFLLMNRVEFPNNIGVIARTAFAAGVNGLIFQKDMSDFFNEDTVHFSVGAIAKIPLIKMNVFEALKELQKNGIKTFSLQMGKETYYQKNLRGPLAFVLGAESKGISDNISKHCDEILSIPMMPGIDSLNVAVSASIIVYEKVRQEGQNFLKR